MADSTTGISAFLTFNAVVASCGGAASGGDVGSSEGITPGQLVLGDLEGVGAGLDGVTLIGGWEGFGRY